MRAIHGIHALVAIAATAALACAHDEKPPQTPVGETHTTSAPVERHNPVPQPNVPNATDTQGTTISPDTPVVPRHGGVTSPGGQYGNGVSGPSSDTHNGAFDPIRDADEHGAGISGHTEDDSIPTSREPMHSIPSWRDGGLP